MVSSILLHGKTGPLRGEDIATSLARVGVGSGDVLVVHSQVFSLGRVAALTDKPTFARAFIKPMIDAVGSEGGILMPTFSFDFCKTGIFDLTNTPTTMGFLGETFRKFSETERTRHPIYSYALQGRGGEYFMGSSSETCFGQDSIFDRMQCVMSEKSQVKLVYFGIACPPFACTYVHALEEEMEVPYRYHKRFSGILREKGQERSIATDFFVRDLDVPVDFNGEALWKRWLAAEIVRSVPLGDGTLVALDVADVRHVTLQAIRERIDFLCKGGYAKLDKR
ncbi:MAG: AAC(3) family N-acetyltransferase [Proteobacteria bacterium]|nr:AAC(3) family N-acetyltransferase [Pseudomonadota bacterium]MBU1611431.1 AAC(3) family N-acetyltransferase [Pseudomonadota bacterium]